MICLTTTRTSKRKRSDCSCRCHRQREARALQRSESEPETFWMGGRRCRREALKLSLLGVQHRAAGAASIPNLDRIFLIVDRLDHQGSLELLADPLREPERSSQVIKTLLGQRNTRDLELSRDRAHSVTPNKRGPKRPHQSHPMLPVTLMEPRSRARGRGPSP